MNVALIILYFNALNNSILRDVSEKQTYVNVVPVKIVLIRKCTIVYKQ